MDELNSLRDAILDNSAIRDGLSDEEAQPLIDWGLALAAQVTLEDMTEARYEELYGAVPKLMTRITWTVLHRAKKGEDWTLKTLTQLNELSQTIHGDGAPQISPAQMTIYATQADGLTTGELVLDLIKQLSPLMNEGDTSE